ncbi:MAG: hypothetical protein WBC44_18060 [Planctomycetaceae bacterium]
MIRPRNTFWPALLLLTVISSLSERMAQGQEGDPVYHARLTDGTLVVGEPLRDWHDVNATPRVGSHALFDPNRPVEWLVRDAPPPDATPASFVEFVGGDRLPGEVIGYFSGAESPFRRLPPHLVVRPTTTFRRPNTTFDPPLRVELKHVRRVVWANAPGEPISVNTARLRDGRRHSFRTLRWAEHDVALLTENGVETIPFHELAAVRFNDGDAWAAYLDHAATLLPDGDGRLIQLETRTGLVALSSTQRLRAEAHGDNRRVEHWYQAIQPAWSLDPLWVPVSSVSTWRFFSPDRVPLTVLDPTVTRNEVVFSASRPPLVNRAVHGGALTDAHTLFGWGYGVQAPCRLSVSLPASATAFRGGYALDPSVGSGGCAKVRVVVEPAGGAKSGSAADKIATLFESKLLIGAAKANDIGQVAIPPDEKRSARRLVLIADPVYHGRPSGADPFDIRDAVNWFAPVVELDSQFIKSELRRRAVSRLPGLASWNVASDTSELATVMNRWDTRDWEDPRFRSFAAVEVGYASMSRTLRINNDRYLAVFAHCPHDDFRPARVQVKIDGDVVGEQSTPTEHGRREPDPLLFPVTAYAGRTVTAEIIQLPGTIDEPKPAAVDWRGAELVSNRPGLRRLFEDEAEFATWLTTGDGSITLERSESQTGSASLRIGASGKRAATLPGWKHVIVEEPDFGEFRFLRFAWRADGRGPIALDIGHDGQFGPGTGVVLPARQIRRPPSRSDDRGPRNGYRYLAGPSDVNDRELTPSISLSDQLPDDWKVVQRDLLGDFGTLTMTGLGVTTHDGSVGLDGVYLARSSDQFRFIEQDLAGPPKPQQGEREVALKTDDPRTYAPLIMQVAAGFGLSGQGGELQLLDEYRGRRNVLRTHPEGDEAKQAVRLTAAIALPEGKTSRLALSVSQHAVNEKEQKTWDLQVFANGREVLSRTIDHAATNGDWLDLTVDLAEFAGRPVRLELRQKSGGRDSPFAYWHNVRVDAN